MIRSNKSPQFTIEIVTDPVEIAKADAQLARFRRNLAWYQAHVPEIEATCRGRFMCIAGEELFVADTAQEAKELARRAHPEDDGYFLEYIPREKAIRIYAHQRLLGG
jgi:hypothetical protein